MDNVFEFPAGLYGFPDLKCFVVVDVPGAGDVVKQLVSTEDPNVGFTLVFPFAFFPRYSPDIPEEELVAVGAESAEQVLLYAIASVPEDFRKATANLRAPVLFNPFTRKGRQVILGDDRYGIREPLFQGADRIPAEEGR
ncbi:flagellar assembly protein FliW [Symbiobacterium thermophilum]|uniref:flagellar assembly protein FliW n=1 Tax=Symbiobacterium thermophilum TaxID=2734 RepID=UPI0035C6901C